MEALDFLYYVIYNFYRRNREKEPWLAAGIVVGVFPLLNISSIYFAYGFISNNIFINKWQSLFISLPIMALTYYRYTKITHYNTIAKKISEYGEEKKRKLEIISIIYILFSFLLFLGLAGYIGEVRNPPPFWDGWFK